MQRHNDYALARGLAPVDDEARCVREVLAAVSGYGPLQAYLDDPSVEELWINAPDRIFVARGGVPERTPLSLTDGAVRDLVERMLHASGRRVDLSQPFVDASMPDGSRLHVVIPDITRAHWSVNIRKFLPGYRSLEKLVDAGIARARGGRRSCTRRVRLGPEHPRLRRHARGQDDPARRAHRRVPAAPAHRHGRGDVRARGRRARHRRRCRAASRASRARARSPSAASSRRRCACAPIASSSARSATPRPSTCCSRSTPACPGAATIHANSGREALAKLAALPLLAGRNIDKGFVLPAVAASVHLVAHCAMDSRGRRRVVEIVAPTGRVVDDAIEARTLYEVHR